MKNWAATYQGTDTCLQRVNNELAFPFYLAELARGVNDSSNTASGRRLLDQHSDTKDFNLMGQVGTHG